MHMDLDEIEVSRIIVGNHLRNFLNSLEVDVAIAGAGPAGLTAARLLAARGKKVVVFERKLSPGGGIWGGGMMFPVIVVQEESKHLLEEIGVRIKEENGYFCADAIEAGSKLISSAVDAGAKIFTGIYVEDVLVRKDKVSGFVINWSAVDLAKLHVDPISIRSKYCIDATGHDAEICRIVEKKMGKLLTPSGRIEEEKAMWAEIGEKMVVENTREVYPGLFVAGMAANAVFGAPRMGPVFGGMLLSGKKVAEQILKRLKNEQKTL